MNRIKGFTRLFESREDGAEVERVLNDSDIGKDILGIAGEGKNYETRTITGKKYKILPDGDVVIYFFSNRPVIKRLPSSEPGKDLELVEKWNPQKYMIRKVADYWYCIRSGSVVLQEKDLEKLLHKLWKMKAPELVKYIGGPSDWRDSGIKKWLTDPWNQSLRGSGMNPWQILDTVKRSNIYSGYKFYSDQKFFEEDKYRDIFNFLGIKAEAAAYIWSENTRMELVMNPMEGLLAPLWKDVAKHYDVRVSKSTPTLTIHVENNLSEYSKPSFRAHESPYGGETLNAFMETNEKTKEDLEDAIYDYLKRLVRTKNLLFSSKPSVNPFNRIASAFLEGKKLDRVAGLLVDIAKKENLEFEFYANLRKIPMLWKEIVKIDPDAGTNAQAADWGF